MLLHRKTVDIRHTSLRRHQREEEGRRRNEELHDGRVPLAW